jgi:hypothetical protein
MAPIRLEMLSGSVLVFDDPAPLIRLFVGLDGTDGYDDWARRSPRDHLVAEDVTVLNTYARARSGHVHWQALLADRAPAWLADIDPRRRWLTTGPVSPRRVGHNPDVTLDRRSEAGRGMRRPDEDVDEPDRRERDPLGL